MADYTSDDLASVKAAILALAAGERVAQVMIGSKLIQYSRVELPQLRALLAEIKAEIQSTAKRRRFVLTTTSKELYT